MAALLWSIDLQESVEHIEEECARLQRAGEVLARFGITMEELQPALSGSWDFLAVVPQESASAVLQALLDVGAEPACVVHDSPGRS